MKQKRNELWAERIHHNSHLTQGPQTSSEVNHTLTRLDILFCNPHHAPSTGWFCKNITDNGKIALLWNIRAMISHKAKLPWSSLWWKQIWMDSMILWLQFGEWDLLIPAGENLCTCLIKMHILKKTRLGIITDYKDKST